MESNPLIRHIQQHIVLTEEEIRYFDSLIRKRVLKKNDRLLEQGMICRDIHYIESGLLRSCYLDANQKESTVMFAIDDWWITDMHCFLQALPALLSIEASRASTVYSLSKNDLDRLLFTVPKFERFFRILFQNAYVREQLRVIENLSLTAVQRYERFIQKYPQIVPQVTQKQIASYLGVTPEFLSAARSNHLKGFIS